MSRGFPRMLSDYCERTGDGFWGEPLNAISNGAFILVALLFYVMLRRAPQRDWPALALTGIVFAIGIGSFLFHTRPGPRTVLADVIPIQIFILGYLFLAIRRFFDANRFWGAGTLAAFLGLDVLMVATRPSALGGSIGYVPALIALFVVGALLIGRAHLVALRLGRSSDPAAVAATGLKAAYAGRAILIAGIVFFISLVFRTVDQPVCARFSVGTHFLWHICNALVLFILLLTAVRHGPATPPQIVE